MRISDWSSDVCSSDLMLLVIVKVAEPTVIKDRGVGLESTAITLARELPELEQQIKSQQQQLADAQKLLALVQRAVSRLSPAPPLPASTARHRRPMRPRPPPSNTAWPLHATNTRPKVSPCMQRF